MIIPVILAGGSGTRLWPLSREMYPKQLLNFTNHRTLLQNTVLRLTGLDNTRPPVVVCNEELRFMVAEQLREIGVEPSGIVLEPEGKNTAPAIAVAALMNRLQEKDDVLLVLPADHVIGQVDVFHNALLSAYASALEGSLVTFGIIPDAPMTGYGYIQKGNPATASRDTWEVRSFVEKPDLETARNYLQSGDYCWNSGMFMFRSSVILTEMERFNPEMVSLCRSSVEKGTRDLDFFRLERKAFGAVPADSVDYAVMEKTSRAVMVPIESEWSDLGSWDSLWQTAGKNEQGNVAIGDVIAASCRDSYLNAQNRLVAAVGVQGLIVVETKDAVLVAAKDQVQKVKSIVQTLKDQNRGEALFHSRVYRPWGNYETIDFSDRYQVKRITVKPGAKLSLQKHYHRAEHWTVVSGTAIITKGDQEILLQENESAYIPLGVVHRLENPGKIPLELIEVQSGSYLEEDDIVRFDDVYGRQE